MRRFLLSLFWVAVFFILSHAAFAEEAAKESSQFAKDLDKAREIMLNGTGDNSLGRGVMVALFEPVFLSSMFCLGLWAGQMSERITSIWALPLFVFGATIVGAFITTYHTEWKPDFDPEKYEILSHLNSTAVVTALVGLLAGTAVGMQLVVAPFIAIAAAIAAGLALGFSQTTDLGEHKNAVLPFWMGFGMTGLMINIFGIGFETFLQSIKLSFITRWVGFATLALSFMFGSKVF